MWPQKLTSNLHLDPGHELQETLPPDFFGVQFQGRLDHKFNFLSLICNLEAINSFDLRLQRTKAINHATG